MNTMLALAMSLLLVLSFGFSFQSPVFAELKSSTNHNIVKNNNLISSFQQVAASLSPIITNFSSKGIYKVQLGWNSPLSFQSLPKAGFSMYIRFMNATLPLGTAKTIPNRMATSGSTTMYTSGTQYRVPGSIQRIVPIKSFDMTIYGKHEKVLWNRVNQVPQAGLKFEHVVLPQAYNGNITSISIHNIKSPVQGVPTDSVDFVQKWFR
jgi:hypothetical protein